MVHVAVYLWLFIPKCLCHQAIQFSTDLRAVMPYSWEGVHILVGSNGSLPLGL